MNKRGFTRIELVSAVIIVLVLIAISCPVIFNFVETQNRSKDRQKAVRAQDLARQEFMLSHYDGEPIVYTFSGRSEVMAIVSHEYVSAEADFGALVLPKKDGFNDGGSTAYTTLNDLAKAKSRKVGERELYVVVAEDGRILYNSWLEILLD